MKTPKDRNHYLHAACTEMQAASVALTSANNFMEAATGFEHSLRVLADARANLALVLREVEAEEPTPAEADAEEPPPATREIEPGVHVSNYPRPNTASARRPRKARKDK